MIVVEGPDGAGKTTFIRQLSDKLEMDVAPKAVNHDMTVITNLVRYVEATLEMGFHPLIYDRFALISGCIYDPVYTGMEGVNRDFQVLEWLHQMQTRFLYEIDPIIIWCLPSLKTVMRNVQGSQLNAIPRENLEALRAVYWLYHCRAALEPTPILYDYTRDNVSQVIHQVEVELEERDGQ